MKNVEGACAQQGIMNITTAIFVDSLSSLAAKGALEKKAREKAQKKKMVALIKEVFEVKPCTLRVFIPLAMDPACLHHHPCCRADFRPESERHTGKG